MKVEIAKNSGFCFGVKRAIDIARDVASHNEGKTYVYGQLVHNERVIDELQNEGIVFVEDIQGIPEGGTTVLRAHGEPGTTYTDLEQRGITKSTSLNDATCPLVTLVHNVAKKLKAADYEVAIFGKGDHPESIGTSYHLKGKDTFFIEKPEQAKEFWEYIQQHGFKKVAIVSQTTMSVDGYKQLIAALNELSGGKFTEIPLSMKDLETPYGYVDTICQPTKQRQTGTEELAQRADIMIVVGGLNSSNSKELAAKCRKFGVETHYIQSKDQLEREWVAGKELVGVTAGASTPDVVIDEVVEKIKELA